jgi:hypothetical protein
MNQDDKVTKAVAVLMDAICEGRKLEGMVMLIAADGGYSHVEAFVPDADKCRILMAFDDKLVHMHAEYHEEDPVPSHRAMSKELH